MKRLGVIGAGKIVPYHIDALREVGFLIEGVCATPQSINARKIAAKFGIPNVYDEVDHLIESEVDALLIAVPKEFLLETLIKSLPSGKKILIEKPVYVGSVEFPSTPHAENVMVAYNRRFYKTVQTLVSKICIADSGSIYCHIPELSSHPKPSPNIIANEVMGNTVHYIDLVHYILSKTSPEVKYEILENSLSNSSCVLRFYTRRFHAILHLTFGSPGNYGIRFDNGSTSVLLTPLESFKEYDQMMVIEPSELSPLRKYVPAKSEKVDTDFHENLVFKPGFLEQSKEFMKFVSGQPLNKGATLKDAQRAAKIAVEISSRILSS